jgi:methyl-accepting chemotaxis protein
VGAVPRPLTALLVAAIAIPGIAACGGDDGDDQAFQDDFPALSERIASLGEQVGNTIETAESASDQELANEFDDFSQRLGDLRQELEELEPPEDLADERDDLVSAMDEVRSSLESIASAAEEGDPEAAGEATLELIDSSEQLRDARQALGSAVRKDE